MARGVGLGENDHLIGAPGLSRSSAYAASPLGPHATVVSNPAREATGREPVWNNRKQPVP